MKNPKEFTLSLEAVEAIMKKHKLGELSTIRIVEKGLVNPMYEINGTYMLRLHIREPHSTIGWRQKTEFLLKILVYMTLNM